MDDGTTVIQALLAWVWTPALVMAGALDWACHRHLRIEYSAGLSESLLHLLMLAEVGAALLAALFLQPTAGLFVLIALALLLHEATYALDLRVALARRRIPAVEQWVHGFQHVLPWAGLAGLMALSPGQAQALLALGGEAPEWSLRLKATPPHPVYTAATLTAALLFNGLPFVYEAWRSLRARQRGA
ncbi:MAG: diguanylate cyclase [Roseateles sp.]|uniref:diguanylate cyclase n=1 Tax=Roseateles sp. TaxID=1971397 RepID=UPI004035767A